MRGVRPVPAADARDEARLRAQFEKCGRIVRARVAKDRDTGPCKGYGFMTFSNKTEARRCVRELAREHPRNYMDGKHAVITHATGSNPNKRPVAMRSFGVDCARGAIATSGTRDGWDPDAEPGADAGRGKRGRGRRRRSGRRRRRIGRMARDENPSKKQKRDKKDKKDKKDKRDEKETKGDEGDEGEARGRRTRPTRGGVRPVPAPRTPTRPNPRSRGSSDNGSCSRRSAGTGGTNTSSERRRGNEPRLARPKQPPPGG